MKKIILFCGLIISLTVSAQLPSNDSPRKGMITGKVIDEITNQALPYVSIVVKNATNNPTTGGITDDNGLFSIKQIPEGENTVEIQYIGYSN